MKTYSFRLWCQEKWFEHKDELEAYQQPLPYTAQEYFEKDNTLIENIFLMISIFHYYHITPIFVFDGKPPVEKRELLIQRIKDKKAAEKVFEEQTKWYNADYTSPKVYDDYFKLLKKEYEIFEIDI